MGMKKRLIKQCLLLKEGERITIHGTYDTGDPSDWDTFDRLPCELVILYKTEVIKGIVFGAYSYSFNIKDSEESCWVNCPNKLISLIFSECVEKNINLKKGF